VSFGRSSRVWYLPACQLERDYSSFSYIYAIMGRVEFTSSCNMGAMYRKDVNFELALASSLGLLADNVFSRTGCLDAPALFHQLYTLKEFSNRATINEVCLEESDVYDGMLSIMSDNWKNELLTSFPDPYVFKFPNPVFGNELMSFSKPNVTATPDSIKKAAPKQPPQPKGKGKKTVNDKRKVTNVHQAVEKIPAPVVTEGIG